MKDGCGRTIDYMRISITDRCNLRCRYCMPKGIEQVKMADILTYEEIETTVQAAAKLGISKYKITGGEPLTRLGCAELIGRLKQLPGVKQVTMTSNGILLPKYLDALLANGLDALNISLDSLNPEIYKEITGFNQLPLVLQGIEMALKRGLKVKVNAVLQKGINDKEWLSLVELARNQALDVRFIEMMPIGYGRLYETIYNETLIEALQKAYPDMAEERVTKAGVSHGNGPAVYYHVPGFKGSIGFISAMHGVFCESCNRIRMTSQGMIKPCLC